MKTFSCKNIKGLRLECGMSLEEVSLKSNIPVKLIKAIEDSIVDAKLHIVFKLLEVYDADIIFSQKSIKKAGLV